MANKAFVLAARCFISLRLRAGSVANLKEHETSLPFAPFLLKLLLFSSCKFKNESTENEASY
jgi:hypothetical protein